MSRFLVVHARTSTSEAGSGAAVEPWTMLQTSAVARGCKNTKEVLEALQAVDISFRIEDEEMWGPVDKALQESGMECEMKLGLAHDVLGLEGQLPTTRPVCASILLHVLRHCSETPGMAVSANYSLGVLALEGVSMTRDAEAALKFFGEAAKQGHALSMYQLAGMFLSGRDMKSDPSKSAQFLKLAVDRGLPQASTTLAEMYRDGLGVPQDYELAFHYFEDAVEKGDVNAKAGLATLYNSGNGTEQDFDKAFRLNQEAVEEAGISLAYHNLGTHYFLGKGAEQSFQKAIECFQHAAEQGFAPASFNLGNLYLQGRGCNKDLETARYYYERAAAEIPDAKVLIEKIDQMRSAEEATESDSPDGNAK